MCNSESAGFRKIAPTDEEVTDYDRRCFKLYLMLLEADNAGQPWESAYKSAFGADPATDKIRCKLQFDTHLGRARWMSSGGYRQLL